MSKLPLLCTALLMTACSGQQADLKQGSTINQDTHAQSRTKNTSSTPLYGAEVYSHEKITFGKFVIRMKMISSPGVVSSFFTYDNESWQGGIPWREIDIEAIGKHSNTLQTNLITGTSTNRIHSENSHSIPDLDSFNQFTLIWTPDKIEWKVNDQSIHLETSENSQQVIDMRDSPQSYRMNVWISEAIGWVGSFSSDSLPLYQVVDWIEYYRYNDGEFELAWRDDFDRFDTARWGKGDWGFDSNLVTFHQNNAGVRDGKLILALTDEATGITPSLKE
ncbi:family 16 glycosylhydrolase [Vibrio sp. ZSDE26]|uniref:Family 16 glycosylhydrolase n=1 Tax=Vibrio amylolyticus TaxID=2847292 RepID=A0A9X1XJT8_9VIBR|nr:family 16 glycosylhydrolase [Vibrio amylolyticus]MCK6263430.1 family 16 glycosylhydrolase [Vibrio amylolyticus]